LTEKLKELQNKLEKVKKEIKEEFALEFKKETSKYFEKYKWLKEISWSQYTPYFNDGDSCEFSVNAETTINGCTLYSKELYNESYTTILMDDEDIDEFIKKCDNDSSIIEEYLELSVLVDKLMQFLSNNSDIALELFGDHVKVSIQGDGVFTEEYEHD